MIVNAQVSLFGSLPDAHIELVDAIRLGEVIIRAELHRLDRGLDRTLAGQHDYFRGVRAFVHAPQQLHAVHVRHVNVAQQHIDIAFFQLAQCCIAVSRGLHAVTESLKFFL